MADKTPDALRTIGEVSRELGVRTHILRYWEDKFPMLSPLKRAGGRRYYRPEDMALLQQIDSLLNREGFTVSGAIAHLRGKRSDRNLAAPGNVTLHQIRDQLARALGGS